MSEHKEHQDQNCRQLLSLLSDYVDGSLEEELCARLENHMEDCENCRIVVDTLRKTVFLYKATAEPEPVPGPVRERLYKRLNIEDFLDKE